MTSIQNNMDEGLKSTWRDNDKWVKWKWGKKIMMTEKIDNWHKWHISKWNDIYMKNMNMGMGQWMKNGHAAPKWQFFNELQTF